MVGQRAPHRYDDRSEHRNDLRLTSQVGDATVNVSVTDALGDISNKSFTLTINAAPTITSTSLPVGDNGSAYNPGNTALVAHGRHGTAHVVGTAARSARPDDQRRLGSDLWDAERHGNNDDRAGHGPLTQPVRPHPSRPCR